MWVLAGQRIYYISIKMNTEPTEDDAIQCFIYSLTLGLDNLMWEELCERVNNMISVLSVKYIWHKDEFRMNFPIVANNRDLPLCLSSMTCFGDNIEDEWYIVYLMLEISKQLKDIIIQVKDNDGDFLLIEAAEYLPGWAKPENTLNRVFIFNGYLHLITPDLIKLETNIGIQQALNFIQKFSEQTKAPNDIENAIRRRIRNYPEKFYENTHKAIVKIPLDIAALLEIEPQLISYIVSSYCNHDIIDEKLFKDIEYSDCILHQVLFTKCLYAMLIHSKSNRHIKRIVVNLNDKKSVLGLKLAQGLKILMSNVNQDICATKDFKYFINNLSANGYFKGNIEGSKDYKILSEKAKRYYTSVESLHSSNIGHKISKVIASAEYLKMKQSLKANYKPPTNEDDESWLNIHPEQLNELLKSRYSTNTKFINGDVITSETITSELSNFLKQSSDFEGIEENTIDDFDSSKVEFYPDQFVDSIEKMLNLLSTNKTGDSDYSDDDMSVSDELDDHLEQELKSHFNNSSPKNNESIMHNIVQSMKEEKASSGPSSNILSSIGIQKTDVLDSDDD